MSTLRVGSINNAAASAGGITIDSSGGVSGALPAPNRNLLYNGAMQVSQRGTSTASITTNGYYTADRWQTQISSLGTWTHSVETDAPTGSGLRRSLKVLCTTADAAPSAGDYKLIAQSLEGQDLQRIRKGTASAQKLTLSFWVKSNVTGTYVAELYDNDNSRSVSGSYTISASATWEKKTITFPADTTGAFDNDNAASMQLSWWLGAGSTFTGGSPLQTAWGTATNTRATGQTNVAAATNNYWQVTGVQLEVGDAATDFEFKSYGQELRECQRYYFRSTPGTTYGNHGGGGCGTSTAFEIQIVAPVVMRTGATAVEFSNVAINDIGTNDHAVTALTIGRAGEYINQLNATVASSSVVQGDFVALRNNNNAAGYVAVSAEL